MINAVVIDEKDTVAVAIEALKKGSVAEIRSHSGAVTKVALVNDIPIYHKFAITEMKRETLLLNTGNILELLDVIFMLVNMFMFIT